MPEYNISRIGIINFLNINQLKSITKFENCYHLLGLQKIEDWNLASTVLKLFSFNSREVHIGLLTFIGLKHGRHIFSYVFLFAEDLCCNID